MSLYRNNNSYPGFSFGGSMTKVVKVLIIINVVVFVIVNLFRNIDWNYFLGLTPYLVLKKSMIWQPLTYMFMHGGVMHLVFNMLMLWLFGSRLEEAWGRDKFLSFYLFAGIGAAICSFLFYNNCILGASGAIFGIFVAYAIMFPEAVVLLFFVIPMKIKHLIWVIIGISVLSLISSERGVAHIAHLGGAFFGYIYLKNKFISDTLDRVTVGNARMRINDYKIRKRQKEKVFIKRSADAILDKIAKQGIESLSKYEKDILERRSKGI